MENNSLNDPYILQIDKMIENIYTTDFNIPIPTKPLSFEGGTYHFPETWDILDNDTLATFALRVSGWIGFMGAEISRLESKKRLLKQKYEYLTEKLTIKGTPKLLKGAGYIDELPKEGEHISPKQSHRLGNTKIYEFSQACLELQIKQELGTLWGDIENVEIKISMLKNMKEAFASHENVLGREISRRQSELRAFSKSV